MRASRACIEKRMTAESIAVTAAMSVTLLLFAIIAGGCGRGREAPDSSGVTDAGTALSEYQEPSASGRGDVPESPAEEEGPVTYKTGQGEVTYDVSKEPVPEEKLGVPVYPAASYVPGSGGTVSESSPEGECTVVGGQYQTRDGFDRVFQWYRERLGEPTYADLDGGVATWNRMEEGRVITVGVRRETDHTSIMIYSLQGDPGIMNP